MKSLKTLGIITVGALVLSVTYALAVKENGVSVEINDDDGKSIRHIVIGDRGEFALRGEDQNIDANWRGTFELGEDGNSIASLDHSLEIEVETDNHTERAVFKEDHGKIKITYFVDDEKQSAGPDTGKAVADLLLQFLRASGLKSDERVAAILKKDGIEGVLTELGQVSGDHSLSRYSIALTEQADLSSVQLIELTTLLSTIEGDHDLRTALRAILEHETITADITPSIIAAARNIEGDHDLRMLVEAFAEHPLNNEAMTLAIDLYERINGDHDLRNAALALLENGSITTSQQAQLLQTAANEIDSDHDMRMILVAMAPLFSKTQSLTNAWLDGFAVLDSSHDQRLSIASAAEEAKHTNSTWLALIKACEEIESSHDKRLALQSIAREMKATPALRAAYEEVATTIGSDHDRRLALEALSDND